MKRQLKPWEAFENRIKVDASHTRVTCMNFPQRYIPTKKIYVKSPVDFALGVDGRSVFLDAKSTHDRLFNTKEYITNPRKLHQLLQLLNARDNGNKAGYLIWFVKYRIISWVPVEALELAKTENRASITPADKLIVSQPDFIPLQFRALIFGDNSGKEHILTEEKLRGAIEETKS